MIMTNKYEKNPGKKEKQVEMEKSIENLVLRLFEIGAIEFGKFKLKHHEKYPNAPLAPLKINLRTPDHPTNPGKLTPEIVNEIASLFFKIIPQDVSFDYLAGIPRTGEPFAEALARTSGKPLIRLEKIKTSDKRKIGGIITKGEEIGSGASILLIDDVITRGESKKEAIKSLEKDGLKIAAIIFLVDREEGGTEIFTRLGYRTISAFTVTEILTIGLEHKKITKAEFQRCKEYLLQARQFFKEESQYGN